MTTDRYEWERVVRRAPLDSVSTLVALTLATYANRDGTSIYPGNAKLAAVTRLNERTVRRALGRLRDGGYIVRTVEQDWHARVIEHKADEYELAIPADFLDRPGVLPPSEVPPIVATPAQPP